MKNSSIFPHEVKYQDLVACYKGQYQVCVDSINHSNTDLLFASYQRMLTFEVMANVFFHSSLTEELEMQDEFQAIKTECGKMKVVYKEVDEDATINNG